MKRVTWAVLTAMGLGLAIPAHGYDPPATAQEEATDAATTSSGNESATTGAQSTIQVEEVRTGAAGMEPYEQETGEDRVERAFVENVWNSP